MDRYDVLIIGGGQAGIPLAHALAKAGKKVALAERQDLGGSCVNFGCTPTKAVIASGREADAFRIRVGKEDFLAARVVLNTGTRALRPPIAGLEKVPYIHSGNWLDHHEVPRHLVFIGAGYVALEMSQFYRRMGSLVTVIDKATQILRREDEDVVFPLQRLLESEGIQFRLDTLVKRAAPTRGGILLTIESQAGPGKIRGSHVFLSAGRQPNTDDLGLETIGVKTSKEGFVEVDERLSTTVAGVFAAGDIRGGPMFTHTSWDDYRVLESQLAGDGTRTTRRVVPYAVYTDPELGRAGMSEREAKESGVEFKVGRFEMRNNGKARELSETEGLIKVLVDEGSGQILGAAVLAADGSELVHMYVDLMNAKVPYTVLRDAVHIHPTLAEAVQSAVAKIP